MSCNITSGRNRKCKTSLGGVKSLYIFPFVNYSRGLIERDGLELTSFPETIIYPFEPLQGYSFEQKMNDEDGGKYYTQSISLQFATTQDTVLFEKLLKKDFRAIITDNNGNNRLLGLYNGCIANDLSSKTGSGKSSFNGLETSFEAEEREEALFINDLNIFEIYNILLLDNDDIARNTALLLENGDTIQL